MAITQTIIRKLLILSIISTACLAQDDQLLFDAINQARFSVVRKLINQGANLEARNEYGATPLLRAVCTGQTEIARLLLNRGVNIEARDFSGATSLIWAVETNNLALIRLLLDQGAKIDAKTSREDIFPIRHTALMIAAQNKNAKAFKILSDRGAKRNGCVYLLCKLVPSNLTDAAMTGDVDLLDYCLDLGFDIEIRDRYNNTALIEAALFNHTEAVRFLLEKGAQVDAVGHLGGTALIWAAWNGCIESVRILVDYGADLNAKIARRSSYLPSHSALMAAANQSQAEVYYFLLSAGASKEGCVYDFCVDITVTCSDLDLPPVANGGFAIESNVHDYYVGDRLRSICNPGFRQQTAGSFYVECRGDGTWSQVQIRCVRNVRRN